MIYLLRVFECYVKALNSALAKNINLIFCIFTLNFTLDDQD